MGQNRRFFDPYGAKSRGSGGAPPTNLILLRNQRQPAPSRPAHSDAVRAPGSPPGPTQNLSPLPTGGRHWVMRRAWESSCVQRGRVSPPIALSLHLRRVAKLSSLCPGCSGRRESCRSGSRHRLWPTEPPLMIMLSQGDHQLPSTIYPPVPFTPVVIRHRHSVGRRKLLNVHVSCGDCDPDGSHHLWCVTPPPVGLSTPCSGFPSRAHQFGVIPWISERGVYRPPQGGL